MGEPFIHLAGVQKTYRTRGAGLLAISEATFDVEAGERLPNTLPTSSYPTWQRVGTGS